MNLTRYHYTGPPSAVSLIIGERRETLDVRLHPGATVELPADHDYTRVVLALNHLQPLPNPTKAVGKPPALQPFAKD